MATFTVTTASDIVDAGDGVLSLREAVAQANATAAADTIVFAPAIEGQTLVLTGGELSITRDITIDGDRDNDGTRVTLSGGDASGILSLEGSFTERMALADLDLSNGQGAIAAYGVSLSVSNSNFIDNGGAIYAEKSGVYVSGSRFERNSSAINIQYGSLYLTDSIVDDNDSRGIYIYGPATIRRSTISNNNGGGVESGYSFLGIYDSTIANNSSDRGGGGINLYSFPSYVVIHNSTITGNRALGGSDGGGVLHGEGTLEIVNSIVAGNSVAGGGVGGDISGTITLSNGHNVFGSEVAGDVAGDREGIAAGAIFAQVDATTGGGRLNADGVAPLRANAANPAQGGADRLQTGPTDQLGAPRPAPGDTSPDAGAAESGFSLSSVASLNNDALTGTAAANTIDGLAGHDTVKGLGGNDTLSGGGSGDFLEGGAGDDRLNGGVGIDLAGYRDGSAAVTVDLRGTDDTDTARRGSETDTLTGIEGAIAGGGNDRFFGDGGANWFRGGGGKDTFTGGAGRDLYDYNLASASPAGAGRDVVTDFAADVDDIDLAGIDANNAVAGDQEFRWVGDAALTGAGQVGFFTSGGNTIVRGSTDADAAAEFQIQLNGDRILAATDFYL